MEKSKQEIIEFWKSHLCDMIPHDSPNYKEKLQEAAEIMYEFEINEAFNK